MNKDDFENLLLQISVDLATVKTKLEAIPTRIELIETVRAAVKEHLETCVLRRGTKGVLSGLWTVVISVAISIVVCYLGLS